MSLYRRGKIWWLYLVPPGGGRRLRRSTGEHQRARAQRIHDELKASLWQRGDRRFLHAALRAWAQGKGEPDKYRVEKLVRLTDDGPLDSLDLEALAAAIQGRPATFNRYLTILHAAGVRGLKPKKPPAGRIRWLTAEEWQALRGKLPEHLLPMGDFAIATGLRQSNVFWLEWAQVDMARRRAWVEAPDAKGRTSLGVPLSDAAMTVLEGQRGLSDVWVFPMLSGNPLPKLKTRDWKAIVKSAEIAYCTWHDLRHTWATWHLMNVPPTPLEVLQKLGGWRDLRMVMRYAHLAASHIDQYANNATPYATDAPKLLKNRAA